MLKDVPRREDKFWGVHVNAEYFYKSKLANFSLCKYLQTGIGIGRFKISHIRYYVSELSDELKNRKEFFYTKRSGLYMDFLYFVNPVYYGAVIDSLDSAYDLRSKITNTGFQLYWDVSTQKQMGRRRAPYGLCWRIGIQTYPRFVGDGWGNLMLKFGVGVSF